MSKTLSLVLSILIVAGAATVPAYGFGMGVFHRCADSVTWEIYDPGSSNRPPYLEFPLECHIKSTSGNSTRTFTFVEFDPTICSSVANSIPTVGLFGICSDGSLPDNTTCSGEDTCSTTSGCFNHMRCIQSGGNVLPDCPPQVNLPPVGYESREEIAAAIGDIVRLAQADGWSKAEIDRLSDYLINTASAPRGGQWLRLAHEEAHESRTYLRNLAVFAAASRAPVEP